MINIFDEDLSQKAKNMVIKLNYQEKSINYETLNFKRDKKLEFDFRDYKSLKELSKEIYYWKLSIDRAEDLQILWIFWFTNCIRKIQTNKTWIFGWKIKAFR